MCCWQIRSHLGAVLILLVVMTFCSIAAISEIPLRTGDDLMNLMAMARSMSTYVIPPMGGSHLMHGNDVHYGLLQFLIATGWRFLGDGTGESLYAFFSFAGIVSGLILVVGGYVLCLEIFGSRTKAAICSAVALLAWGPVVTQYSGDYSLVGLTYAGMLPQTCGMGLALLSLFYGIRSFRKRDLGTLTAFSSLVLLTALLHFLSLIFLATGLLAYISATDVSRKKVLQILTAAILAVSASVLWPFYRLPQAVLEELQGPRTLVLLLLAGSGFAMVCFLLTRSLCKRLPTLEALFRKIRAEFVWAAVVSAWLIYVVIREGFVISGPQNHVVFGVSLYGLLGFLRKPSRTRLFLTIWAGISLLGYLTGQLTSSAGIYLPYWWRLMFFAMLPLHYLLADYLCQIGKDLTPRRRTLLAASLGIMMTVMTIHSFSLLVARPSYILPEVESLARSIPQGSVIISDESTSAILAGYYGFIIVWPILHEERATERIEDVYSFLNSTTLMNQLRLIASDYGADHLVVPLARPRGHAAKLFDPEETARLVDKYNQTYSQVFKNKRYIVYSLAGQHATS